MAEGIEVRHHERCGSRTAGRRRCTCSPSYRAAVWQPAEQRLIRKTFGSLDQAKAWRFEAAVALRRGGLAAGSSTGVREAGERLIAGMESGTIRTRSGDVYKPSVIRSYRRSLSLHVLPPLGAMKLREVRRRDVQNLADRMLGAGADPSTVRNALMPLRVIFRRALEDGELAASPVSNLRLPAVRGRRERIAAPSEASALVAAAPEADRAIWATAFYAGLRLGELMALDWSAVDLAAGIIRVERSWDPKAPAYVLPKSRSGARRVPIAGVLRDELLGHRLRQGSQPSGLAFGRTAGAPLQSSSVRKRARSAWRSAGLDPIGFHECRHTFAALMIGAGVNAKALSTYMGHASIAITLDRYGHLMPGNEDEAALMLDAYLARADTAARLAQLPSDNGEDD